MAANVEAELADLLLGHVAGVPGGLPVAYPNRNFTPPASAYLEAVLLPNTNVNLFLKGDNPVRHQGILQVSVMYPTNDAGLIAPMEIAGAVVAHFKRGTRLRGEQVTVRIDEKPSVTPPITEPNLIRIPVSIRYFAFA